MSDQKALIAQLLEALAGTFKDDLQETGGSSQGLSSSVSGAFGRRCLDTSAAVDEFRGQPGMAAEQWLKQFEYVRRTGHWDDINTMAVVSNKMKGPARTRHLSHNEDVEDYKV